MYEIRVKPARSGMNLVHPVCGPLPDNGGTWLYDQFTTSRIRDGSVVKDSDPNPSPEISNPDPLVADLAARQAESEAALARIEAYCEALSGLNAELAASLITVHRQLLALQEAVACADGVTADLSSRLTQADSDSRQLAERVDRLTGLNAALSALTISNSLKIQTTEGLVQ